MSITLNKEDTLQLIYDEQKRSHFKARYSFSSKYPSKCLKCLSPIYISYKQFSNAAIFCDLCKHEANTKNNDMKFVQAQYMRVVKERQLTLVQSFLDKIKFPNEQ